MLLCATLAVTTGLAAQATGTIVPSAAATGDPGYFDYYATYGINLTSVKNQSHGQYIYDNADVGGAAMWKSVSWRRTRHVVTSNVATTFNMDIIMSNSPFRYDAPSSTFTANHGSSSSGTAPRTVFSGKISLPANQPGQTWPDPWFVVATFRTAFAYTPVKGGSLVVECLGSNNSARLPYYCEGWRPDFGERLSVGSACRFHSDGGYNNGISYQRPFLGGTWFVQHNGMPSNEPNMKRSLNIIGRTGAGGTVFGKTLPVKITELGFQDICNVQAGVLANDLLWFLPMTYTPDTSGAKSRGSLRSPTLRVGNEPTLVGLAFYSQPFCVDKPLGGSDRVYMGWPSKWIIGSGKSLPGSVVYRLFDNARATGTVRKGYGRTCMFK